MIKNRTDMYNYFSNIISDNYDISEKKYIKGNNAVKSYIVETHNFKDLERNIRIDNLSSKINSVSTDISLKETEDESIISIKKDELQIYGDISNKRFMILHSASKSNLTDDFFQKIASSDNFDNLWLPDIFYAELLEKNIGKFYGTKIKFQNLLDSVDSIFSENNSDLDLSTKNKTAKEIMSILMNSPVRNKLGLSKLSLLNENDFELENNDDKKFMIDDIYYNGKVTAKGNSFDYHISTVIDILTAYHETLNAYEKMAINMKSGFLEGKAFKICFSNHLDVEKLIKVIFNGSKPFKLFGMDEKVSNNRYKIYAVDMHNGNPGNSIVFYISSKDILFSINEDSCANTIFRLLANINHYIDASANLMVGDKIYDKRVFGTGFN